MNDPGSSTTFKMPTVDDYKGADSYGYQNGLRSRIAGTDQWNDLILKVCQAQGVNPIFLKLIMATESGGNHNIKKSPSGALGLMQIMPSWGFDNKRLQSDPEYAITKACEVFKSKSGLNKNLRAAQNNGGPNSVFNIAHAYIGWGKDPGGLSKSGTYHAQIAGMYEGFGLRKTDSVFTAPTAVRFTGGNGKDYTQKEYKAIYDGASYMGPGGFYDSETYKGISGIYDKPTVLPPHYYNDDFSTLRHRYTQGDFFLRIGDSRFVIPPTQLRVQEQSNITRFNSLRQKQSMKVSTGNKMRTVEMSLMFTDYNQVNGYEMKGPAGQTYHMDGLRSLLAQMKTMPFLPVENEFLNFAHGIYAVAILSINVGVVDGFPGMLKADLTLIEFDPEPYLNKPAWMYDSHFIWPIYRWHYQRLLNGRTKTGDAMAPFVGDDVLNFWHLDEDALNNHAEEVEAENNKKAVARGEAASAWEVEDGTRVKTWWDFNDKLAAAKGTNKLFKEAIIPPNYSILDVNATFGNNLTPLTPSLTGKPAFQYFGSQDARFNFLIQTDDRQVIQAFNDLKDTVDRYAREYREGFVSGMLRLENNFVNMLGVKGVLIESLSTSTVEGSPGTYYIAMTLISFDETQHGDAKLGHIDSIDLQKIIDGEDHLGNALAGGTLDTFDNNITQAVAAEKAMNDMELYPDLELPTYTEFNKALREIEAWRKEQGLSALKLGELTGPPGAKYVDPDFYFSYPSMQTILDSIKDSLSDPDISALALEQNVDLTKEFGKTISEKDIKTFFGEKAVAQIEGTQDAVTLKKTYEALDFGDLQGIDKKMAARRTFFTDPASYTRRFWIKAWSGEGGEWQTKSLDIEDGIDNNWKMAYYGKQSVKATVNDLSQEDFFIGMMHDMMKYDRRGTMMRAFPSYVFVIIDEGRYVNVRKLWDNYYTYHAISEINVHMDRKNPIHTAYITLSNVYGALNNKGVYHQKVKDPTWGAAVDSFLDSFVSNVTEKEMLERTIMYDSIQLMAGARIHVRMGYGSAASSLPPVFNGTITEINAGDMVSIVAQSFGYELANEIGAEPGSDNSMFEQGLEATELFRYYMTERQSNFTWAWRDSAEPENYQSAYGIEHFGFLRVHDDQTVSDMFSGLKIFNHESQINAEDYDIMKNIYSTAKYQKIGRDEEDGEDETNIRMQLEGKAPWDVFRTLERVTPEYIVYPHIHQFGYTLFFGKPWWDVQCGYVLPPVKNPPKKYGKKISDYVELSKPFSQAHFYTSYGDIIGNNIKAVGTDLATVVIPVFQLGKKDEAYEMIWADYYIRGSFQRTKTIDTSVIQNIPFMPNWMESLGTGVLGFFDGETKYQKHSVRFAQAVIAETFKDMYQGELTVFGDGSVKPYDIMYIDDFYAKMNGTADVGSVTHMLSVDTGFITSINPDLSVIMNPNPEMYSEEWANDPDVVSGNFFRYSNLIGDFALQSWRVYSFYKIAQFIATEKKVAQFANLSRLVTSNRAAKTTAAVASYVSGKSGLTAMKTYKGVRNIVAGFRANAVRSIGFLVAAPGPGWAGAAVSVASVFASTMLLQALDKMFVQKYNNVIKIFPLFYQGRPYVAGINGHKQLIPGWEDNGNGKPVRVDYGNVKKLSPNKASELFKEMQERLGYREQLQQEMVDSSNARMTSDPNAKVSEKPAEWLGQLSSQARKGLKFVPPVELGKEGAGYAGVIARTASSNRYRTKERPSHAGLDFPRGGPSKKNDAVLAFARGEVVYKQQVRVGFGTAVIIKHRYEKADGSPVVFWTLYAHMSLGQITVETGDFVEPGQLIGWMGEEGNSQGIHLHFEVHLPKNAAASDKVKRGQDSWSHLYPTGVNTHTTDPAAFMESIVAYDANLMSYVKFKG